jgi:hypothetical protein
VLESHPQLAYLNEPRHIWLYEPRTDIWSKRASRRKGRLSLTATDVSERAATRIRRAFAVEVRLQRAQRLVEKLPVNSFRIGYILGMFPDAMFIHMARNGIEVANSIAARADSGRWYLGTKWEMLSSYARQQGNGELVELCTSHQLRGLLEWRLHVCTVLRAFESLPNHRTLQICYEDLTTNPFGVCDALEKFIGVETSPDMRLFASTKVDRRSPEIAASSLTPQMLRIAGEPMSQLGYL